MTITDPEAIALIDRTDSPELDSDIEEYPEDEREGRSDLQIIAEEAEYIFDKFRDEGWRQHKDLTNARKYLLETKNGTEFPGLLDSRQLKREHEYVAESKDFINEYRRLQTLMRKLEKMGYVSEWR